MAPVALLSVSDKSGLVPLAEALHRTHGYQLLSSGGTAKVLEQAGLPVTRVSEHTGAPEILGGRVKTLHPRVHGGILAKRGDAAHQADLEQQNIAPIDVVVVNLYPFRETIARPDVTWDQAIEIARRLAGLRSPIDRAERLGTAVTEIDQRGDGIRGDRALVSLGCRTLFSAGDWPSGGDRSPLDTGTALWSYHSSGDSRLRPTGCLNAVVGAAAVATHRPLVRRSCEEVLIG